MGDGGQHLFTFEPGPNESVTSWIMIQRIIVTFITECASRRPSPNDHLNNINDSSILFRKGTSLYHKMSGGDWFKVQAVSCHKGPLERDFYTWMNRIISRQIKWQEFICYAPHSHSRGLIFNKLKTDYNKL